ncbi:major facilitator superfamily transporter [Colletotrichum gloeosporioides Cg-14]|uniref:Major facilitator superfamily transporter n=1 Tax=Colletotrichum gloeosporioides (strain Cg-14) TaxID=1237896 RepID=T0LQP0_COLGC|nr:major facilitator superfamily transporter [Colletotrichum gloeosporioides Cg-14]
MAPVSLEDNVPSKASELTTRIVPAVEEERKTTWRHFFWDAWDKTPEERRLIFKMDITLMTFGCLGTFIKYIDRSNLNTAFVSGMKEEMSLYGNELNYANTAYSVANIIGLWPVSIALTRSTPRYFIPLMETGWTICTLGQAFMRTPLQMYVMRFLLGLFETGHWSSIIYLCGAWYQKRELSRRIAIMNCATSIGPMFSSYLQAAAYTGLNGVHGLSGWRWLFIIDTVISVGIIIPQFFFYPDVPARQQPSIVFSEAEIELARDRNPKEGRVKQGAFTWAQAKRCVTTPDIFLLWLISVCNSVAHMPSDSMAFWFKAWNTIKPGSYTVPQINNYTTPLGGVTVILTLVFAWSSDTWLKGRRWPMLVVGGVVTGIVCILLAATPVFPQNKAFRWFLYYNTNWAFAANTMFWSWTQDTLPLFAFKTVDQPAVIGGNWGAAGMAFLYAIAALTLAYIQYKREKKRLEAEVETSGTEHSG